MSRTDQPRSPPEHVLTGIPVSPGIAIGPLHAASEPALDLPLIRIATGPPEAEFVRLDNAVARSKKQLEKPRARLSVLPEDSQQEIAPLIDAYTQMLSGSRLLRRARERIANERLTA